MKNTIKIIFFLFLAGCSKPQESKQYFEKYEKYEYSVKIDSIIAYSSVLLNNDRAIILGARRDDSELYFNNTLFLIDKKTKKILFDYSHEKSPYGENLYHVSVDRRKFVLWKICNEYYSDLLLFQFVDDEFSYVGKFEVALNPGTEYMEDLSYPVKGIEIIKQKNKVNFIFTKSVILFPYDEPKKRVIEGQLIYQFDFNKNELKVM